MLIVMYMGARYRRMSRLAMSMWALQSTLCLWSSFLCTDIFNNRRHLFHADVSALHPLQVRALSQQHISSAGEFLGTWHVQYVGRIRLGSSPESNSCGEVGFDKPRYYISGRPLSCKNQMDSSGSSSLGETNDRCRNPFG